MKNKQIEIAKAIGILLVIAGHSFGAGIFAAKIYHMPLFFFISGLTFKTNEKFRVFILKKIRRLYVPFILYEIVYLFLTPLMFAVGIVSSKCCGFNEVVKALTHIVLFDNYHVLLSPIWFVTALFASSIIVYFLYNITKTNSLLAVRLVAAIILVYIGLYIGKNKLLSLPFSYNFPEAVGVVSVACGYILIGIVTKEKGLLSKPRKIKANTVCGLVGLCMLMVFERTTLLHADMRSNSYDFIVLQPMFALIGIYGVFSISRTLVFLFENLKCNHVEKVLMYIASHTFSLMCLHPLAFKVIGVIQVYFLGKDKLKLTDWQLVDDAMSWKFLVFLSGVVIPLLLDIIYEKVWRRIKNVSE